MGIWREYGKFNLLFHSTDTEFISVKDATENFKEEWKNGKNDAKDILISKYPYIEKVSCVI